MEKTIVQMTDVLEMVGFLKTNGTQCRFVSLISNTLVKNIRAACPWKGHLRKISNKIGIINANYNTSVRRRLAEAMGVTLAEVEYENGDVWYQHIKTVDGKNLPLVVNKKTPDNGEYYIQYFPHRSDSKYVFNGTIIPEEAIEPYFYAEKERPSFKPCVLSVNLTNVKLLKASGVVVEMPGFDEAEAILAD